MNSSEVEHVNEHEQRELSTDEGAAAPSSHTRIIALHLMPNVAYSDVVNVKGTTLNSSEVEHVNEHEQRELSTDEGAAAPSSHSRIIALHLMPNVAYNFEDAKRRIMPLFERPYNTKEENDLRLALRLDLKATNMNQSVLYLGTAVFPFFWGDQGFYNTPPFTIKAFTIHVTK
ncbi:unnamed protein product [Gongylonema pulchrum]|uniref:Uncharacterized protein n=1 Tax=Gongylonema pulchrum TaxID=637853 RepID=A0A3P7MHH8_9BILA|nr:unnamed protein product [Gongylonema pulchrum]